MASSELVVRLYAIGVGLLMSAVGLALLFDFRGYASRHARWTHAMFGIRVRRHWWQFTERGAILMDRAIGAVFAIFGLVALVVAIAGHVTMD